MTASTPVRITPPPVPGRSHPWRWTALAALVVLALVAGGIMLLRGDAADPAPGASPSALPSSLPSGAVSVTPNSVSSLSTAFRFQPLWPFASVADAAAWQAEGSTDGSQAWRLDPARTALRFAATHLRYREMNRVTSREIAGEEAWIGVAGTPPEGRTVSAAVLHLARIGVGPLADRPWEVVGSRDTLLTLTTPRYGSVVGSTIVVGGRISGVDESLVVQVLDRAGTVLTRKDRIPAGGVETPWQVTLVVPSSAAGLVTIAVSTGGHIADVEKFAITAVTIRADATAATSYPTAEAALAAATTNGSYQGDCDHLGSLAGVSDPVCSRFVTSAAGRSLYRLGFVNTDAGCFVILGNASPGHWTIVDPWVAGPDVPTDLGGPIPEA